MRALVLLGRACFARQGVRSSLNAIPSSSQKILSSTARLRSPLQPYFRQPRFSKGRYWVLAGAALSPLSFVNISEGHDESDGKTSEELMLAASRKELKEHVPKGLQKSRKVRRRIYFFLDQYIWEPICTGFRFIHLVLIFVPVIITIPAIWIGKRQPKRDNERSGSLWWYGFLVTSMERAGAAFIKVGI